MTANLDVNHAPTLSTATLTGTSVAQYATGAAISVNTLMKSAGYADADGKTLPQGIAIIGAAANLGSYQFMLAGGTWQAMPSVAPSSALLLPSTASVRYIAGSSLGTATLTFEGWDETQGSAGQTFNIAGSGGPSAFSTVSTVLSIAVTTATNHAPTLSSTTFSETAVAVNATGSAILVSKLLTQAGYADQDGSKLPQGIAITGASGGTVQYMLAGGSWQPLPSVSASSALLLPSTASVRVVAGNQLGTVTLTFDGWDETQGTAGHVFNIAQAGAATGFSSASATASIPVGQAPSWSATAGAALTSLSPGTYSTTNTSVPAGNTIASVFGNYFVDVNSSQPVGVAISGATGNGAWQFSLNGGNSWVSFTPSKTAAELLSATDLIRFVPKTTAAVTGALTAYAWDGSAGTDGGTINLTQAGTGGASAFSATTMTDTSAFDTAPTLATSNVTLTAVKENVVSPTMTASTLLSKAGYADPDGKALPSGIAITGDTGPGAWQWLNGSVWTAVPSVSSTSAFLLPSGGELRFLSANNLTNTNSSATLTYLGWDETAGVADKTYALTSQGGATPFSTASATVSMPINFVKQPPNWLAGATANLTPVVGFSSAANPTPNPAGDTIASVFGTAFHDANGAAFAGIAISAQTGTTFGGWQFSTNGGATWQSFPTTVSAGAALLLSANDKIRFVPSKSFSGIVSLTAYAWDGTGSFSSDITNVTKTGIGGSNPFSATTLTASAFVNSAPTLS